MDDKKAKAKNFSQFDKEVLVELVLQQKELIENKKTDSVNNAARSKAWDQVALQYNSLCQTGYRTAKQLKELYLTIKRNAKKNSAHDRAEHFKTGGGIVIDKITDLDKKLLGGLSEQFNPDQNEFDSSAPLFTRVEDSISSFGTSFVHNTPILLPTPSIPLPSSMSPVTPFTDIEPSTSALPISNTTPKQIQNVQVCNLAAPLRNTTPIPIPNQTSNTTTIPTPKTTKRKRQTEDLVNVIEERKKMKNKLAEIEWKKKEKDLDEERRQKQELHQFKMKYQETLIAGAEIDNEIKKIDLRIKQKQLYDLSL